MPKPSNRDRILKAGLKVMFHKGYVGAGVRDIVAEAPAPQGSFTNHFRSKEQFAREVLDLYFGDSWASGQISTSPTGKRVRNALCDGYEINNAAALMLRSSRRSLIVRSRISLMPL